MYYRNYYSDEPANDNPTPAEQNLLAQKVTKEDAMEAFDEWLRRLVKGVVR